MEPSTENEILRGDLGNVPRGSGFESVDKLNSFAQTYFASDFSNPERRDCPATETLHSLIRSGKLPGDELRAHLFGCSECFSEYQSALAAYRAETRASSSASSPARSESWFDRLSASLKRRPLPVFASVFSFLLITLTGAYLWRAYKTAPAQDYVAHRSDPHPAIDSAPDSANQRADERPSQITPSPSPVSEQPSPFPMPKSANQQKSSVKPPRPREQKHNELLAMAAVSPYKLDLNDYAVTRGGDSPRLIRFPRSRQTIFFTLPEGSLAGSYTVSILDANGNPWASTKARSADGKNLRVTLDMQHLTAQKYLLRIAREGETPDVYGVIIDDEAEVPQQRRR
jgi:hypothetical protein